MIETARLMRALRRSPTVRFVGFACEEPPYCYTTDMGSQVYARQCRTLGERVKGMLCLEMVGYYSTAWKPADLARHPPHFSLGIAAAGRFFSGGQQSQVREAAAAIPLRL